MRNVTILLAVLAMLAVTAQAALVDEDFNGSDPGWTDSMSTNGIGGNSDFGFDDPNDAITGKWYNSTAPATSKYCTGITAMDQGSTFTLKFDITGTGNSSGGADHTFMRVGLLNTGGNNDTNAFGFGIYHNANKANWKMYIWRNDSSGTENRVAMPLHVDNNYGMVVGTLYHCEINYDGAGNVVAYVYTGDTKPTEGYGYYSGSSFGGTWSVNAFGTTDTAFYQFSGDMDATIDNMYLVPEPATLALLGLGGIGVLLRRRKK